MQWLRDLLFEYRSCRVSEQAVITAVNKNTGARRVAELEQVLCKLADEAERTYLAAQDGGLELPHLRRAVENATAVLNTKQKEY